MRALRGERLDVAVDLRQDSSQFGQWFGLVLSAQNRCLLLVPLGFPHGFLVLSDFAEVSYKATELYAPAFERTILWNDPAISIDWPLDGSPTLSVKDRADSLLAGAETYPRSIHL